MAARSFKNTGRRAALFAALAVLTLPGVAFAAPDDRGDSGEQRHGRGEVQRDDSARGDRGQARQEARQEQQSRAEPAQRSWRGPNTSGWTPPAAPAAQEAASPNARFNTGWGNRGADDNRGRQRGDREGRNGRWSGGNPAADASPAGGWRGQVRGTDDRRGETRNEDHRAREGGYRDGHRDANRDVRITDSWRRHQGGDTAYRDGRNTQNWGGDRSHDRNHSGYGNNHHRWDHDWRHNNRYNWYSYRNHNRDVFRWGSYYSPYRNYSYRRLSIGFFLDSLFYSNRYWINDPWQYRLPDAYGPYRWVRYYDDALLVDIYSGEVVDVINNFFW